MDSQSYDASRIFAVDTGPICRSEVCPRCSCPTGKVVGDTWYHEFQDRYLKRDNDARCVLCECKDDGDGNLYSYCPESGLDDDEYTVGTKSCPPHETYQCHESESKDSGIFHYISFKS